MRLPHRVSLPTLLVALLLTLLGSPYAAASVTGAQLSRIPDPHPGQSAGAGGGAILVVGGVGGDNRPVADVSVMVAPDKWERASLESPLAHSAAAQAPDDSFVLVGGIGPSGASAQVLRLRWHAGKLEQTRLPDLPTPRILAGATVVGHTLYVVGGLRAPDATAAESDVLTLDLRDPAAGWQTIEPFPGAARVSPTVVAQYDVLHIFGGRAVESPGNYRTLSDAWIYRPEPLEGTTRRGWIRCADLPRPLAAAAAFPSGQAHVLLLAGDQRPSVPNPFDTAPPDARQPDVLGFHAVTDTWTDLGPSPVPAAAGATAVKADKRNVLVSADAVSTIELKPVIKSLSWIDYAVIAFYFVGMAMIGLFFSQKQTSSAEFSLGGRRTSWWVAALSIYATGSSAISFMAIPAQSYATSLVFFATAVAHGLMIIPQAWLVVPMIRRLDLTSTYEYLERRFNPPLRLLASLQCILFQTIGRMSVVLLLPAMAISAVTGINVFYAVLIMGLLTTFYTAVGGIDAVMWTDVIQAVLMFFGPVVVILVALFAAEGGPAAVFAADAAYGKFNLFLTGWDWTMPIIWIFLIDGVVRVAGFAGDQTMVQRVLCTPSDRDARRATLGAWGVGLLSAAIFQVMGTVLFGYFHTTPDRLDPTMRNDQILPLFVIQSLPVGVAGLIVAALFAASMSTLSGTMNSVATLIVEDFYRRFRPGAPDRTRLRLMIALSYVVGAIGTAIALYLASIEVRSMMATWNTIMALLGGGFLGIYTLGMFSTRANSAGAITGALASVVVTFYVQAFTRLHWTLYTPVAILTCIFVGYAASLLLPSRPRDLTGLTVYTLRPRQPAPQAADAVPA